MGPAEVVWELDEGDIWVPHNILIIISIKFESLFIHSSCESVTCEPCKYIVGCESVTSEQCKYTSSRYSVTSIKR